MKNGMTMKWAPTCKRRPARDGTTRASLADIEMHKRYTSPLVLTRSLCNALKYAKVMCHETI